MGFFGKSEAELKQMALELDKKRIDLDNRESDLDAKRLNAEHQAKLIEEERLQLEKVKENFLEESKKEWEKIASKRSETEERILALAQIEAEAKAKFAQKQQEAFKEVIELQTTALNARQKALDETEKQVSAGLKDLRIKEGNLAKRELAVTEREQKADAGFADQAKSLADEAARQYQANQAEATRLKIYADDLAKDRQELEKKKAELTQREWSVSVAEQQRDEGFADERTALGLEFAKKREKADSEISQLREKKLSMLDDEITKLKTKRLDEITKAEQAERDRVRTEITKDRDAWTKQQDDARKQHDDERIELEKQRGALSALRSENERRRAELEANEKTQERTEQRREQLWQKRNERFDDEIEAAIEERRKSLEKAEATSKAEIERLRESLRIQTELVGVCEQLKRQLGGEDPASIIRDLNAKTDELKRLREELATRPTEEMRERNREIEVEVGRLKARNEQLEKQIGANEAAVAETAELRRRNHELDAEKTSLAQRAERYEGAANEAQAELNRLRAAYERPAEVAARYKEIEMPHIKAEKLKKPTIAKGLDEIAWLAEIGAKCDAYGLHFNPRILKAFHTALKTAEWSPLTILAGVSGTGKSELPRLYSHFGGLMFEPLAVQPNWDSQESMLGFFNSIDNKFDAQPVLRFLAQSQKKWEEKTNDSEGYPGLQDAVCLILLDEMNLAHPELYFAEFLSKLELRRGMKGTDVPFLPVKIGAGMPPYQLPLGRNVLWTGTMNQDETTKSLSDKVLDRSIIIHFPRPTELKRRLKLAPLDDKNRGPLLHKTSWQSWLAQGSLFSEEDIKPFKTFIEGMNASLSVVGRAIGHRVWQSIEYYMANYPDVCHAQKQSNKDALSRALHTAFEDQLVQKVMPKLRGIDTRGKSKTECLDKILSQINAGISGNSFNLAEDFHLACELGYGQFIWQSANYIKDDLVPDNADAVVVSNEESVKKTPSERAGK